MFERLLVQNFQAHGKTAVEFSDTVTTVVGESDAGKSALLRALRWVCTNSPQGDAFIKDGTKGTMVKLFVDSHRITRKRSKRDNEYQLDDETYKAFGSDVPDPIADLLNLTEDNFQSQLDPPYWFSESAGEVSRQLNAIVDLQVIDDALGYTTKRVRAANQKQSVVQERLTGLQEDAAKLQWVPDADCAYGRVESKEGVCNTLLDRKDALAAMLNRVRTKQQAVDYYDNLLDAMSVIEAVGSVVVDIGNRADSLDRCLARVRSAHSVCTSPVPDIGSLVDLVEQCSDLQGKVSRIMDLIVSIGTAKAKLSTTAPDLTRLAGCVEQLQVYRDRVVALRNLKSKCDSAKVRYATAAHVEAKRKQELEVATEGQCPVCGGDL